MDEISGRCARQPLIRPPKLARHIASQTMTDTKHSGLNRNREQKQQTDPGLAGDWLPESASHPCENAPDQNCSSLISYLSSIPVPAATRQQIIRISLLISPHWRLTVEVRADICDQEAVPPVGGWVTRQASRRLAWPWLAYLLQLHRHTDQPETCRGAATIIEIRISHQQ